MTVKFHHFPKIHNGKCFKYLNDFLLCGNQIMIEVVYSHKVAGLVQSEVIVTVFVEHYHGSDVSPCHPHEPVLLILEVSEGVKRTLPSKAFRVIQLSLDVVLVP